MPDPFSTSGLVYVSDTEPGIRRHRAGKNFCYRMPGGELVRDPLVRQRISALGLPPAYDNVWICLQDNGHLQATGYDARGRKQYRYHKDWQTLRSADKFRQLVDFGRALPRIRRAVMRHLSGDTGDLRTMLAALTVLLDQAYLRAGNRAYAKENATYGATTLLKKHVKLGDDGIELRFAAKGGKRIRRSLRNRRLQRILEECSDLPGRQLFVWVGDDDAVHPIDSSQLNTYLTEIAGTPVTAKTFRTWGGSLAAFSLARAQRYRGEHPTIKGMAEAAAAVLHNTPAVARGSYIHPAILAVAEKETNRFGDVASISGTAVPGLRAEESRMLRYLESALRKRSKAVAA